MQGLKVFDSIKKQLAIAIALAFVLGLLMVAATRCSAPSGASRSASGTATAARTGTPAVTSPAGSTTPGARATDALIVPPGGSPAPSPTQIMVGPQPILTPVAAPNAPQPTTSGSQPPAPQPPTATSVPAGGTTYVVQRGDTLSEIAKKFGVTTAALSEANGITNPSLIRVGQRLRIPGTSGTGTASKVHVVARGENLSRIAAKYGVTVNAIVQANNLKNPSVIYAGQRLIIP